MNPHLVYAHVLVYSWVTFALLQPPQALRLESFMLLCGCEPRRAWADHAEPLGEGGIVVRHKRSDPGWVIGGHLVSWTDGEEFEQTLHDERERRGQRDPTLLLDIDAGTSMLELKELLRMAEHAGVHRFALVVEGPARD